MKIMPEKSVQFILLLVAAFLAPDAAAEIAPKTLGELQQSELIVIGTIEEIRIEAERSRIERAFGNYDWGIYIKLRVEAVEKGQLDGTELEFRCFRIKSRRSAAEYLTPSGHRPIPGVGTRVRVHLNAGKSDWGAALPNGITMPDATDENVWSDDRLSDAAEVLELRSLMYTYVLPLELWGILLFFITPIAIIVRRLRRRSQQPSAGVEDQTE